MASEVAVAKLYDILHIVKYRSRWLGFLLIYCGAPYRSCSKLKFRTAVCFLRLSLKNRNDQFFDYLILRCFRYLQCFDAVGWAAGRASGL